MSELIKREDVQREIQASFDEGAFRWQDGLDLLDRINALPTASPWHRVEEPPEDNTWCVFISENEHNFEQYRWIGTYSKEWGFQDDDRFMVDNVKYWMPLPEPPKEE